LPPGMRRNTHCTRSWVCPRACLDGCRKSPRTGIRSPDRPACSESLYRLPNPAPLLVKWMQWRWCVFASDSVCDIGNGLNWRLVWTGCWGSEGWRGNMMGKNCMARNYMICLCKCVV
jgi:hypothetical protein